MLEKFKKKRKHKVDCQCCFCKARRGESFGKDNSMYGKENKWGSQTEETKKKMKENRADTSGEKNGMFGKKHKKETRDKIGKESFGRKHKQEAKDKISKANSGERNGNWQGGISNNLYPDDWTEILRDSIRCRDNYICQECGTHQDELIGRFKKLDVHHIDYNKENCDPINLISLCRKCHLKTNYNREYWFNYFYEKQGIA